MAAQELLKLLRSSTDALVVCIPELLHPWLFTKI